MFTELGIVDGFVLFLFPAAMAFVAASDLFTMRISNLVSVILIAAFAILAPFVGFDLSLAGHHLAAGATVLAIGFACFSFGWVGGGDAKIAAATALWFGWLHTLDGRETLNRFYHAIITVRHRGILPKVRKDSPMHWHATD